MNAFLRHKLKVQLFIILPSIQIKTKKCSTDLQNSFPHNAEGVLVDLDHFLIEENLTKLWRYGPEVIGHKEGGS